MYLDLSKVRVFQVEEVCPACERCVNELGKTVIAEKRTLCQYHRSLFAALLRDPFVPQGLIHYWLAFLR